MLISSQLIRVHLALLALPLAVIISGCNKGQAKPAIQADSKLDAIRQAGYPVTLAELNAWYVEPPTAENAASVYAEAFAALAPLEPTSPAFLAQNKKALELFHQAASLKKCRYPADLTLGAKALMPHLAKVRKGAQLLSQQASSLAANSQMDQAVQSLLDGLCLARSLEQEPLILSHFIGITAENVIEAGLESILSRKAFSEAQLALIQAAFHQAETGVTCTRSLAGERSMGIAAFQLPPPEQVTPLAQMQKPPITIDFDAYRKSPAFSADFDFYLDLIDQGITAANLPFPKSLEGISQWTSQVNEAKRKGYHISALVVPALGTVFERAAECLGGLRVSQTALAVERYRLAHQNALPGSLGRLTPQFLAEVPADPFDGQPLRYRTNSSAGFVVYSIGKDRADNGGFPKPAGAKSDIGCDLTFVVKR